jgi:ribosomal subunit interface protein
MEISITVRHTSVTDDIKERAHELIEKLSKRAPRAISAKVVLDQDHGKCLAELKLHLPGGHVVVASSEHDDFRTALDRMVDKAAAQLIKTSAKY